MERALGAGQPGEHLLGAGSGAFRQTGGLVDDRPDSPPGTFGTVRRRVDIDSQLGCSQAGPGRLGDLDMPTGDGEPLQARYDFVEVGASIDQARKRHVAGDPSEAVPPSDGGQWATRAPSWPAPSKPRFLLPRIRATAQAAPKPLSIPTTHSPGRSSPTSPASAVTPSSEAP